VLAGASLKSVPIRACTNKAQTEAGTKRVKSGAGLERVPNGVGTKGASLKSEQSEAGLEKMKAADGLKMVQLKPVCKCLGWARTKKGGGCSWSALARASLERK
jgi:hypothetical protein